MLRRIPPSTRRALLILLVFLGFSLVWIPLTDGLLGWLVQDPARLTRLSTYKGMVYLGLSGLLLYLMIVSALRTAGPPNPEEPAPTSPGRLGLMVGLFGVATGIVALIAVTAYHHQRIMLEREARKELAYLAQSQRDHLELWFGERLKDTVVTASDPLLRQAVLALNGRPASVAPNLRQRLQDLKTSYGYRAICLLGNDGQSLLSTNGEPPTTMERNAAQALGAQDPPRLLWELEEGEGIPSLRLIMMAPILDGLGRKPRAVLAFHLDLEALLETLLRNQPTYHGTTETILACRQGNHLRFLNRTRLSGVPLLGVDLSRSELVGVQAMQQGDGTYEGSDYRGVPSLAAAKRLSSVPWVLYTKMDRAEATAPLVRLAWVYTGIGGLILLLLGAVLSAWWSRERAHQARLARERELLDLRLQSLSRNANDIVLLIDEAGRILDANDRAFESYGYRPEELRSLRVKDLRALDSQVDFSNQFKIVQQQRSIRFETIHVRKDGSEFPVEVSSRTFEQEGRVFIQSIVRDISERRMAEARLRASEERFRKLFEDASEGLILVDADQWVISEFNQAFLRLVGTTGSALLHAPLERLFPESQHRPVMAQLQALRDASAGTEVIETRLQLASGESRDVLLQARLVQGPHRTEIQCMFTDLTETHRQEREREGTVQLLRLLNEPQSHTHDLVRLLTRFLQEWARCEAVGIRLRKDEDFPYFETRGFPASFVEQENQLCARDLQGQLLRDDVGDPVLECMCGNILCRRFDPRLPFFTANGSFWTNSTTQLLASTSETERQARTRNRCHGEGYESVALIPLKVGDEVLGLIQLNDHAPGRFTRDLIDFLEQAAHQIALALAQRRAQEELAISEKRFRDISQAAGEFLWESSGGRFTYVSDRVQQVLGYAPEELLGRDPVEFFEPSEALDNVEFQHAQNGFQNQELVAIHKDGHRVWLSLTRVHLVDAYGKHLGYRGVGMDITERKRSEEALAERERAYRSLFENMAEGAFRQRRDGALVDVNPSALRMLGVTREAFLGRHADSEVWDVVREDGSPCPPDEFPSIRALKTGLPIVSSTLGILQEGTGARLWMEVNAIPEYRMDDSVPQQVLVTLHDITARMQAENALRASESRFRTVADHTYDWEYWHDTEGRFLYSSPSCERITGYPPEAFPDRDAFLRLVLEEDRPKVQAHVHQADDARPREELQFRIRHRDGRIRWIGHVCRPIHIDGQWLGIRGSNRDITEQKRAQEWLRESEERLRRILEATQVGTWEWDLQTGDVVRNARWAEILGLTLEDLVPATISFWSDHVHPEDLPRTQEAIERHLAGERPYYESEYRIRHRDGHWVWVLDRGRVTERQPDGRPLRMSGTHIDITARKTAEEALKASEKRYAGLFNSIQEGFSLHEILTDDSGRPVDYRFLDVNPAFEAMTGLARSQWVGRRVKEILPGLEAHWIERYGRVALTGEPIHFEERAAELGQWFQIHAFSPQPGQFAVLSFDISDRKKAESAVQDQIRFLNTLLDTIPLPIFSQDADGRYAAVNGAFAALLGRTKEDLVGKTVFDIAEEPAAHRYQEQDRRLMDHPGVQIYEAAMKAADGSLRDMVFHKATFENAQAKVAGIVGIMIDITERKRSEAALQESEGRVRAKLAVLLEPEGDLGNLELTDIVDIPAVQALMDEFHALTHIGIGIIDLAGRVLVGTGWQEACTAYHRVQPEACRNCLESDLELTQGLQAGEFRLYRCKNHMWDMVTPVVVGGRHMANLFLGQFFFEGEVPDETVFRTQAERFGFDPEAYLKAIDSVPRWSRDTVDTVMRFYAGLAQMVSNLSYSTLKLARTMAERERAEEALRRSERFLREAQEVGRAGCYLLDFPKGTWESTDTLDQIFGIGRDYPRTIQGWLQLVDPADREPMGAYFQNLVATGGRFDQDYRIRRASDGQVRWVTGLGELGFSETGELVSMIGTIQDITERKRAEEALQDANQRLNLAVASGQLGIWDLDLTTMEMTWNDEMFHLYGHDRATTRASLDLWARSLHPEDAQATQEAYLAALRGERDYDPEFRIVQPGGAVRHVKANAIVIRDADGQPVRILGLNRDITEQKRQEEELRLSEEKFRNTVQLSPVGKYFYRLEPDGRLILLDANPAADRIIGIEHGSLVGRTIEEAFPGLIGTDIPAMYRRIAAGELASPQVFEIPYEAYGIKGFYDVHVFANGPRTIAVNFIDISTRKQAEQAILRMNEELEERVRERTAQLEAANKELEAFSYSVSHDLRAPLRGIDGFSLALLEDYRDKLDADGRHYLERVRHGAQRMGQLIDDLLRLSRVSRCELEPRPVNLSDLASHLLKELQQQHPGRQVRIEIAPDIEATADPRLMAIALENLLANAWKFTQNTPDARISFGVEREEDRPVYTLRDNGAGFDMAYAEKLFQAFQRLHSNQEFEGTGIGLAIVQRIIHRHGGRIWAEGRLGEGATFRFVLSGGKP